MGSKSIVQMVGERIRYYRIQKELSQEALAHESGLTPAYIGQIERGQENPTVNTLNKICTALDISISEIFDFDSSIKVENEAALDKIRLSLKKLSPENAEIAANIVLQLSKIAQEK